MRRDGEADGHLETAMKTDAQIVQAYSDETLAAIAAGLAGASRWPERMKAAQEELERRKKNRR